MTNKVVNSEKLCQFRWANTTSQSSEFNYFTVRLYRLTYINIVRPYMVGILPSQAALLVDSLMKIWEFFAVYER